VPFWYSAKCLPRTPPRRSYSERISSGAGFLLAFFVDMPFRIRCKPRADDSNAVRAVGMRDNQDSPPTGNTRGQETCLSGGMIWVFDGPCKRIAEDRRCLYECDPVTGSVATILRRIPLELHVSILPRPLARGLTVYR